MVSLTFDTRPVPWSRSVRGDRTKRRLKQDKYIADLAMMLKLAAKGETFDGPIAVALEFNYEHNNTQIVITPAHRARSRIKRPDVDNLAKMVLEAIEKSGIVNDDSQVSFLKAEKIE